MVAATEDIVQSIGGITMGVIIYIIGSLVGGAVAVVLIYIDKCAAQRGTILVVGTVDVVADDGIAGVVAINEFVGADVDQGVTAHVGHLAAAEDVVGDGAVGEVHLGVAVDAACNEVVC